MLIANLLSTVLALRVRLLLILTALLLCCCASPLDTAVRKAPTSSYFTASDKKQLSLRHWNLQARPKVVIIALHGIEGAARDFTNLGSSLASQSPGTTLYALNLRGNGYDRSPEERGDIRSLSLWKRDLLELHQTLRRRHPNARLIWLGESMGALVALQAAASSPPEGLILTSPVVSLDVIPAWQIRTLKVAAALAPGARVSLKQLAGGSFQATASSDHFTQSQSNPYQIDSYTLRYLRSLATLSQTASDNASKIQNPALILHGGKDFLIKDSQISEFANAFLSAPQVHQFESSHHLLFYDKQRSTVISRILTWIADPLHDDAL